MDLKGRTWIEKNWEIRRSNLFQVILLYYTGRQLKRQCSARRVFFSPSSLYIISSFLPHLSTSLNLVQRHYFKSTTNFFFLITNSYASCYNSFVPITFRNYTPCDYHVKNLFLLWGLRYKYMFNFLFKEILESKALLKLIINPE